MTIHFLTITLIALIWTAYKITKTKHQNFLKTIEQYLLFITLLASAITVTNGAVIFQYKRSVVLSAPDDLLKRFGIHFIIGYRDPGQILPLVRIGALGGAYVTSRNVDGRTLEEIKSEIEAFQRIASAQKNPPLFIAADQEGGRVSRLAQVTGDIPSLASIIGDFSHPRYDIEHVQTYASIQAEQLAAIGVNVNLSPVVDIKTAELHHQFNRQSRIDLRAISADADIVTQVGEVYCNTLLGLGIRPTLKHFPGLGNVTEETHFTTGTLLKTREYLEQNEWRPFREISQAVSPFIMLGHVRVPAIDPDYPVSLSSKVISGLLRSEWGFDGVLITDDFNMGAIAGRKEGIGRSAVRALNAGADLILLSYDGDQYYEAMYELLKAYRNGQLDLAQLDRSKRRLLASKM